MNRKLYQHDCIHWFVCVPERVHLISLLLNSSMNFTGFPSNNALITKFLLLCSKLFMDKLHMLQITTRRQLRSSCSDGTTLVEPRTRCVTLDHDRAFSACAPRLWSRLPGHIKDSTFEQFRRLLKSHFFKNAYQQ